MKFRPACVDDCARIAALHRISSDGVADYIWTTLAGRFCYRAARVGFPDSATLPLRPANPHSPIIASYTYYPSAQYQLGPLLTPPAVAGPDAPLSTLMLPADVGGAYWPAAP